MRRRFLEGHAYFVGREPERLAAIERRLRRYEDELEAAGGLDPTTLQATYKTGAVLRFALVRLGLLPLVLPLALAGALLHWPAYRLAGWLAARFSKREDAMLATIKTLAAMLFFPLTWVALFLALWLGIGVRPAVSAAVAFLGGPATGYLAVRFGELLERTIAASRAAFYFVARPRFFAMLLEERRAIREEILRMADELDRARAPAGGVAP